MQFQSFSGDWQFSLAGSDEWLPATVPGGVHTDLLAQNRIPNPFAGDNEKHVQWVAQSDWVYRRSFKASAGVTDQEKVFLVCDGLDTLAELWLNGTRLGSTANMFRQFRWDVKSLLKTGDNELIISFASPVKYCMEQQAKRPMRGVSQAIEGGPHLRKAPCQFGWDWGPQLPPIGIWQDLRLEGYSSTRLTDVHLRQVHERPGDPKGKVTIEAVIEIEKWQDTPLKAVVRLFDPDGHLQAVERIPLSPHQTKIQMPVENPQLWWTNGLGAQPLYRVEIDLLRADTDSVCDSRRYQVGLRTIELRQRPDEWGKSFEFLVNGIPVFAKGSNWIPADTFPTQLTDEHLELLIRSAAETHQNMLRVWGGGFYEEERFYDLCDRFGILIWQDFIFSCSVYPLDEPDFLDNVHQEVIENVHRLRHRASLALWCGNNEIEMGWVGWGWNTPELQPLKSAYDQFFHHTLPAWVAQEDPDHPYWPSSPSSDIPFENPNGEIQGDAHYWDVWHGRKPFTAYRTTFPRFQSEFGFQSLPPLETIKTYADEADWNMTSYIMEHHQRSWNGNGLMIAQMTDTFRMPKDFASLVYLSLVLQAEGIRFGVEHWRRQLGRVMGTLYWQLNDCWPVASWSSLDYYGRWKALHYLARRFYAPVLLSIEETGKVVSIHVTNDQVTPFFGSVKWRLETLNGAVISQGEETVLASPLADTHIDTLDFECQIDDENHRQVVFICELLSTDQCVSTSLTAFAPNKHLTLENPKLTSAVQSTNGLLEIILSAQSLARFVELSFEEVDVIFSDNYFDIPAGAKIQVTCQMPAGWTLSQARQALRLRSLFDSFA